MRPANLIWALIRREIATRFGSGGAAYIWAFIVPISWVGFGIIAFTAIDRTIPISTHPALFLATGILPYVVFRQSVTYVMRSLQTNRKLTDLPSIALFDLFVAYAVLEGLNTALVVVFVFVGLTFWLGATGPDVLVNVLGIFLFIWL
ncbi:MAG: hypothetical protein AAF826_07050, partial [Pseudomonadota bacterium]